jgi:integrase
VRSRKPGPTSGQHRKHAAQRLSFSAEPFPEWPQELRARWQENCPADWHPGTASEYRRAFGRFRAWTASREIGAEPCPESINAYLATVDAQAPAMLADELYLLQGALAVLYPSDDRAWLLTRRRRLLDRTLSSRKHRISAPGRSLPFEVWPIADQERWRQGLKTPGSMGSRLERYRRRRAAHAGSRVPSRSANGHRSSERRCKPPHRWSAPSIRSARYAYGAYLKVMQQLHSADPAVTARSVAEWVETMVGRLTPLSLANRVHDLHAAMRILHPEIDWHWLRHDAALLSDGAATTRDKLQHIADVQAVRKAAVALMRQAERAARTPVAALAFQDGIIMLLLSYRPVRRRNLVETRIGRNLVFDPTFHSGHLVYDQTKTGTPYDVPLPAVLLPWARKFIEIYRPLLVGPRSEDFAWLSRRGTPLSGPQLCRRIAGATEEELGRRITPHLFRDCLATTVSELAPERIEDAARLLGHDVPRLRKGHTPRLAAIEVYRLRAGTTAAARRLSELQNCYRVQPRPRARSAG